MLAPLLFSLAPQLPHFFHSRIATVTPVNHPLNKLILARVVGQFIVRLKLFSKWELSIGLNFKTNVLYKSIASKNIQSGMNYVSKNTFKWWLFNGVARTFPTHKHRGVGRGAGI